MHPPSVSPDLLPKHALAFKGGHAFAAEHGEWRRLGGLTRTDGVAGNYPPGTGDDEGEGAGAGGAGGAGGDGGAGYGSGQGAGDTMDDGGAAAHATSPSAAVRAFLDGKIEEYAAIYAAKEGRLDVLEFLYGKDGEDFDAEYNASVIQAAAKNGHVDVLKFLDGRDGVDFRAVNSTAVIIGAAKNGHVDVLKFMDGKPGVDFSARDSYAACVAAENGHLHVLEFLEGKPGVDFSARNNYAAFWAERKGQIPVLEPLDDGTYRWTDGNNNLGVLKFLERQPGVRMAECLGEYPAWQAKRAARENKQNALVAKARSGDLTVGDVVRAEHDKDIIFRELENLLPDMNVEARTRVRRRIAEEYNHIAFRNGNRPQLVAHWSKAREQVRHRTGSPASGPASGSAHFQTLTRLPRHALAMIMGQLDNQTRPDR